MGWTSHARKIAPGPDVQQLGRVWITRGALVVGVMLESLRFSVIAREDPLQDVAMTAFGWRHAVHGRVWS